VTSWPKSLYRREIIRTQQDEIEMEIFVRYSRRLSTFLRGLVYICDLHRDMKYEYLLHGICDPYLIWNVRLFKKYLAKRDRKLRTLKNV
jgi:hypothetical protein